MYFMCLVGDFMGFSVGMLIMSGSVNGVCGGLCYCMLGGYV